MYFLNRSIAYCCSTNCMLPWIISSVFKHAYLITCINVYIHIKLVILLIWPAISVFITLTRICAYINYIYLSSRPLFPVLQLLHTRAPIKQRSYSPLEYNGISNSYDLGMRDYLIYIPKAWRLSIYIHIRSKQVQLLYNTFIAIAISGWMPQAIGTLICRMGYENKLLMHYRQGVED